MKQKAVPLVLAILLVPTAAHAVAGFTPQVTAGVSIDKTSWVNATSASAFPGGASYTFGARLGYDLSFIPLLSIDIGATFEYHRMKISDSIQALVPDGKLHAFLVAGGPSARLNLGLIEPFVGIDFGALIAASTGVSTADTASGFAVSPYGGAYFRLLKFFSLGPIIRFSTGTLKSSGTELGTGKFVTIALSLKLNI
jgi:hypothetical protein